jgi:uncharacterized protein YbjT (DUF2867 family)
MNTALIAGATGLVGNHVLQLLLGDLYFGSVIAVTRKPVGVHNSKLSNPVVDFDNLDQHVQKLKTDIVFCCLGTTIKQAGSRHNFWKVDHDYVLSLARITRQAGAKKFLLVSALGANRNSSFFYNEVKGKLEEAIGAVGFEHYHILRPALLLGNRSETRPGEDAAKTAYRILDFMIPKKYKAIQADRVARAMVHFAKSDVKGTHIHNSIELQSF